MLLDKYLRKIFFCFDFEMQTQLLAENNELESYIKDFDTELGYDCTEDFLKICKIS